MEKITEQELIYIRNLTKTIRIDTLKMIFNAKSGHPGGTLSAVDILTVLYAKCLRHFPNGENASDYEQRDRFILSKGHASAALYSVLAHFGYFSIDELLTFRKLGSKLQGHPSRIFLPCIEVSTGSLGQGLSIGCGMALGLKLDKNPAKVVVYMGDGELQEGNVWEGIMNIAHHKLDNIIAIVDRNKLQIDGTTDSIKSLGDVGKKFEVFGWNTYETDGHDINMIYETYKKAAKSSKPAVIVANTIKGKGVSFMENNLSWHGKAPNKEELEKALSELKGK